MALGERIRACRRNAGMSQEKVAELVGVSRQAVTKWEVNQSAPNTENLFKLAEIFGTTVDMLITPEGEAGRPPAEPDCQLCKLEAEKKRALKKQAQKRKIRMALLIALGYMVLYGMGRIIWCDMAQSSLIGWLFTTAPSGGHSYLYGWLLSSNLFWVAMAVSVFPALFGKQRFSCATLVGFVIGLLAGILFGPNPKKGAALGISHYGWAIWGVVYLASMVAGVMAERHGKPSASQPAR